MARAPGKMAEAKPARRARGFEHASGLLAARIRKAGEGRGFATSRVLTHWAEIVGPDLAALARPVRASYGREGLGATLTLVATGAAAPLVQMRGPEIIEKVNACYGYGAIAQLRVTQSAPEGFAEPQAGFAPAPKGPASEAPRPESLRQANAAAEGVTDPGLRAALEMLARNVFQKS